MSELQKQWAVRLPDGSLYGRSASFLSPGDISPLVFDAEREAQAVLAQIVASARTLGVADLAATLSFRYVSEWSPSALDAEGPQLVEAIERELLRGDPQ